MKTLRRFVIASLVAGALSTGSTFADIIIDDFSAVGDPTPWPVVINTITSVDILENGLSNVIGGMRHSTVRATFLEELGLDFVQAAIVPNFGMILDYSSTAGARGDWNLLYDRNGAGLNADFSSITDIVLEFARFDYANGQPLPILVTVGDGVNFSALSQSLSAPGTQNMFFTLSDFPGIGSVDLSNVQSISVFLDPGVAVDFRLSQVFGVPAPGSIALLAAGTLLMVGGRCKRLSLN